MDLNKEIHVQTRKCTNNMDPLLKTRKAIKSVMHDVASSLVNVRE